MKSDQPQKQFILHNAEECVLLSMKLHQEQEDQSFCLNKQSEEEDNIDAFREAIQACSRKVKFCIKQITQREDMKDQLNHTKDKQYECSICHKVFKKSCALGGHMTKMHPKNKDAPIEKNLKRGKKSAEIESMSVDEDFPLIQNKTKVLMKQEQKILKQKIPRSASDS